jgi:hypothetical protein
MRVSLSTMRNKIDRNDARGIAQMMRGPPRAFCCASGSGPHLRVAKRSSMLCAIVAVARKLAGILHRMWIDGSDFKVGFGAKGAPRLKLKPAR